MTELNKHAQALGRMARGKRKSYTPEQIRALTQRLVKARALRWAAIQKAEAAQFSSPEESASS